MRGFLFLQRKSMLGLPERSIVIGGNGEGRLAITPVRLTIEPNQAYVYCATSRKLTVYRRFAAPFFLRLSLLARSGSTLRARKKENRNDHGNREIL
jgi:hypothetical protein